MSGLLIIRKTNQCQCRDVLYVLDCSNGDLLGLELIISIVTESFSRHCRFCSPNKSRNQQRKEGEHGETYLPRKYHADDDSNLLKW